MWFKKLSKKHNSLPGFQKRFKYLLPGITIILLFLGSCEPFNDEADTLEGVWNCTENSSEYGYQAYEVNISYLKSDSSRIGIDNFYNLGKGKMATADIDIWDLSLRTQTIDGFIITGSGTISGDLKKLKITYQVDDGSGTIDKVISSYER